MVVVSDGKIGTIFTVVNKIAWESEMEKAADDRRAIRFECFISKVFILAF